MHCAIDSAQWHRIKKLENWKNCLQLKELYHTIKNVVKIIGIKIIVWPFWPHFVHCAPWPWQEQAAVPARGLNMIALPLVTFNVDNLKHKRHSIKLKPCIGSWKFVQYFVQLGFNFSNGETGTLESSSILIYFIQVQGILRKRSHWLNEKLIKRVFLIKRGKNWKSQF